MKLKKCKQCGELFERNPLYPFAVVCSPYCAVGYARKQNEKAIAKKKREFKQNDKKHLINVARDTFNKYIRLRDKDEPCISCGYISDGKNSRQWHAGHYRPAGQNTALRFDERNVHKQCEQCNRRKSGNLVHYRENLITKIGVDAVAILETEKSTKKWSVEELQEIIKTYKQKIKDLE